MTASEQVIPERPVPTWSQRAQAAIQRFGIGIPFAITFIVLSVISPPFLRSQNLTNILDQQAGIIIVACAGSVVLIAGGIDRRSAPSTAWRGRSRSTRHRRCRARWAWSPASRSGSPSAS